MSDAACVESRCDAISSGRSDVLEPEWGLFGSGTGVWVVWAVWVWEE
jgi:hypothetical protein